MTQAFDAAHFGVASGAGTTGTVEPYTNTRASIARVAQKVREARHDADLRGWAIDALAAAGYDGRARTATIQQTCQVLLDAVRRVTTYVPDPAHTEWIQAPHVTLCLRDKCIRGGDCDDMCALVAALLMTVGVYAFLVRQEFGAGQQEHVLVGTYDERGEKLYVDPANTMTAVYRGSRATREFWVDPLDQPGETGGAGPDFVTLGALPGSVWSVPKPQINQQLTPVGLGLTSVSDLDQLDAQVQAGVTGLQDAAKSCTGLSQSDQDSLAGFALAWSSLHNWWQSFRAVNFGNWWNPTGPLTAAIGLQFSTVAADMRGYLAKVGDWQTHLKAVCPNYAPPPGPVTPVSAPDVPSPAGELATSITGVAKAVGGLLVVGAVAYGVFKGAEILLPLVSRRRAKT